ncbi:triose-phosphate isomerase [soil metagenome]
MSSHSVQRPVLAGNWKMNLGPADATSFFATFLDEYDASDDRTVVFFPPAISFAAARAAVGRRGDIALGVQNVHWEDSGAFTGETSVPMAAQAGAGWVLAGHSERRHVFGETDEEVAQKVAAALDGGMIAVACVGETLDQREAGSLRDVLLRQLDAVLERLPDGAADRLVIAYDPVWAIGTGRTATPADAAEAHGIIRARLRERIGDTAEALPILYGGSVKPDTAAELLAADGVDGLLVGGASLDAAAFARIAAAGKGKG